MSNMRESRTLPTISTLVAIGFIALFVAPRLTAQVTITNTGNTGSSGIQMSNGSSVSASSSQVSIFADSGTTRGKINNGGFNGGGALPIATWPCTTPQGGIVWGATAVSGIAVENCLAGNSSGTVVLSESSTGVPSWVATTGTGSAVFAASPTLSGTPTLPTGTIATTQAVNDSSTAIATTAYVRSQTVRLSADTAGSSSATLGTTGITFTIAASQVLSFTCQLAFTTSTGGLFLGITGPTSPTNSNYQILTQKTTAGNIFTAGLNQTTTYSTTGVGIVTVTGASTTPYLAVFSGTLENNTNAGTLTIQYANGSTTGSVILKRGSFCTAD